VNALDRLEIENYLKKILDCLPPGYKVLLVADTDNPRPRDWITIGDLSLQNAEQAINSAMAAEIVAAQSTGEDSTGRMATQEELDAASKLLDKAIDENIDVFKRLADK